MSMPDPLECCTPLAREPMSAEVVRAMLCIRINTLLQGHSGIRVQTLQALAALLNAGIVPVVPQLGSVGASGDLAPLSHLAIVLLDRTGLDAPWAAYFVVSLAAAALLCPLLVRLADHAPTKWLFSAPPPLSAR